MADFSVVKTNFQGSDWVDPTETLVIQFDQFPEPDEGRLAIFIGKMDVTSLARRSGKDLYYTPTIFPLTPGSTVVTIYLVSPIGFWKELQKLPLQVLSESGFETASFNPSFELNLKTQIAEARSADAGPRERGSPNVGLDFTAGFTSLHKRDGIEINSRLNIFGTTYQEQTLRFGEQGPDASPIELEDYLVDFKAGSFNMGVGHFSYGNHRYLLDGFGSRGVRVSYDHMDRFYFSVASMNATAIAGWDNPLGLDSFDHNITAQTVGVNVLQHEKGSVNFEVSHMHGAMEARSNFNEGQVVDTEESDGFGVRMTAQNIFGRFNADVGFAQSAFINGDDAELTQGIDGLVEAKETTDKAYYVDASLDIIQNWELFKDQLFNLSASAFYERIDPLYKSVGGFVTANQIDQQYGAQANLGAMVFQYTHSRNLFGITGIPSLLTTRTLSHLVFFSVPFPDYFGAPGSPNRWYPTVSYTYNNVHQLGLFHPALFTDGGFDASNIPDQISATHSATVVWTWSDWNFTYNISHTLQDNRQEGREETDSIIFTNDVSLGGQVTKSLYASMGGGRTEAKDLELGKVSFTYTMNYTINWDFHPTWDFSGRATFIWDKDSKNEAFAKGHTLNAQITKQIEFKAPWGKNLPGRVFLDYTKQENFRKDHVSFNVTDNWVWIISGGISITLF